MKTEETGGLMKPRIIIAILLIALGIVAFAYQGITYTIGSFIHILLVVAIIVVLIRVVQGRSPL